MMPAYERRDAECLIAYGPSRNGHHSSLRFWFVRVDTPDESKGDEQQL
jgi:hypothetical protein